MYQLPLDKDVSNCIFSLYFQQDVNFKINLTCTLSGDKVQIPIRHTDMSKTKCLYELDSLYDFIEQKGQIFRCSCCGTDTSIEKFGVDRLLMDAIARLELLEKSEYQQSELFVSSSTKTYFAIRKIDNTAKLLPGLCASNIRETRNSKQRSNSVLQLCLPLVQNQFSQYFRLIKLGKKSLNNNFVFTIKTSKEQSNKKKSMIIIYYVHYKIWVNYELKLETGKDYCPFDNALYIKDQQKQCIYVIGGQPDNDKQTTECFRIIINQEPFSKEEGYLKVSRIPDLLQEGYNYMGCIVHHIDQSTDIPYESIYILNGIRIYQKVNNPIYYHELLNVVQVFRNNRWKKLDFRDQLVPRIDGSFISFDQNNQRIIFMFGGIKEDQKPQTICQLFNCNSESISSIEIEDPSICRRQPSIIFTLPYFENNFLLIFKQDQQQDTIYKINALTGKIQQINYLRRLQQLENLHPTKKQRSNEVIQPIFDFEGEVLYGKYQTIQSVEQNVFNLLVIDLFNGSINKQPYKDRETSQAIATQYFNTLPDEKNQEIQIKWGEL